MGFLGIKFASDGYDAMRHDAEKRADASQQLATQQQQQYYSDLMKYMQSAGVAQQGAASGYNQFQQQGTQRYADSTSALNRLMPQFAYSGGVGGGGGGGGVNPYQAQQPAQGQATYGGTNRTTPGSFGGTPGYQESGRGGAAGTLNRNQRANSTQNSVKDPLQSAQQAAQFDPYQLTEAQQGQMNGQIDRINGAKQTAIENMRASYAQRGISDPRAMQAGMQMIEQQFGGAAEQAKSGFLEQQRAEKQQTIAQMMQFYAQQQGQGQQQQLQGIQGGEGQIQNLMALAQNPGLMNLMQFHQQNADNNNNMASGLIGKGNPFNDFIPALGNAIGTYYGGGFNPMKQLPQLSTSTVRDNPQFPQTGRMPDMMGR